MLLDFEEFFFGRFLEKKIMKKSVQMCACMFVSMNVGLHVCRLVYFLVCMYL